MEYTSNKRRLVKNTSVLYARTLITMVISLYTSRVILQNLGVEDYGIYTVVGGFVSMFAIISSTLTGTTQRYLTYEIGKKENSDPQRVFGISMNIHILLSIVIVLILETFGLWFLNNQLNINPDRLVAANWVYQFSIVSFVINVISTPYNAVIIAHEKMKAFAYISLIEVVLKLIIVYMLVITPWDRLCVYSFLLLLVSLLIRVIYGVYCGSHFSESKYQYYKGKDLYKEIFTFASMNFIGASADILCNQGVNVILNLFFGVTANAARGIANSVQGAISRFVSDFTTAIKPQIMKEYAAGNINTALDFCYMGSRFSFYLMLFLGLPISINAPYILHLWLGIVPEYAADFIVLTLVMSSIMSLSFNVTTVILSNGNLKAFTFWIGITRIAMLPVIFLALKICASPQVAYLIVALFEFLALIIRLLVTQRLLNRNVLIEFAKYVFLPLFFVMIICIPSSLYISSLFEDNYISFIIETLICLIITSFSILFVGLKKNERMFAYMKIRSFITIKQNKYGK